MVCAASTVSFFTMPYAACVPCAMVCPAFLKVSPTLVKKLLASALVRVIAVATKMATRKACQCVDLMLSFRKTLTPVTTSDGLDAIRRALRHRRQFEVKGSCLKLQAELAEPSRSAPRLGLPTPKVYRCKEYAALRRSRTIYAHPC